MTSNKITASADRDSMNRAYNVARAEWHRHRAAVAIDSSARILHEKFVLLYRAPTPIPPVPYISANSNRIGSYVPDKSPIIPETFK